MKPEGKGICGMAAETAGDLISRSALKREMAGIALNTEKDVRAWIEAELLVEGAPAVEVRADADGGISINDRKEGDNR